LNRHEADWDRPPAATLVAMSSEEELAAGLDEDEATAKAATPGPWYAFRSGHGDDWYVASRAYGLVSTGLHSGADGDEILMIERDRRDADYLARHDPARALRYVDAARDIMKESGGEGHGWAEHEPAYYAGLDYAVQRLAEVYDES
jgi:Family of unknown function (DUF6221)